MQAWWVARPGPVRTGPLRMGKRAAPVPGAGEVRMQVSCCGVCRTDLHLAEGDLPPRRPGVVPGHEVVGYVDAVGARAGRFALGDRVGVAWLGRRAVDAGSADVDTRTCACRHGSPAGTTTAAMPSSASSTRPSPTACRCDTTTSTRLPCCAPASSATEPFGWLSVPPGGGLGIYGFGASAHLTAQLALRRGHECMCDPVAGCPGARARARRALCGRRCRRRRPNLWTQPSCSPRWENSSRSALRRWTAAGRSRSPAST